MPAASLIEDAYDSTFIAMPDMDFSHDTSSD
jgi:hypothetical protein